MAIAAAALVACEKKGVQPTANKQNPLADSSDQVMYGIDTYLTDRGLMRAELKADTGYFFDDNTRIELRNLHVTFYTQTGQKNAVLTSTEGTYNTRLLQTEARKNVVVTSEDGKRLTTEQLKYQQNANLISSDSAFVLTQTDRTLKGIGFTSDPNLSNIKVLRNPSVTTPVDLSNATAAPAAPPPPRPDSAKKPPLP
ncbi:MAG: LPS export ABC transporter periplasmic protein LptC [Gemmatimonadota bacterium]|nr:LPS export ABC transporter periplasmic protein LptC [Gemmatimonadota bacterium]